MKMVSFGPRKRSRVPKLVSLVSHLQMLYVSTTFRDPSITNFETKHLKLYQKYRNIWQTVEMSLHILKKYKNITLNALE